MAAEVVLVLVAALMVTRMVVIVKLVMMVTVMAMVTVMVTVRGPYAQITASRTPAIQPTWQR